MKRIIKQIFAVVAITLIFSYGNNNSQQSLTSAQQRDIYLTKIKNI